MLALAVAFSAQSSANRNSLTILILTLIFDWSLQRLKTEAVSVVLHVDSIIRVVKCIKWHRRKHETEKSWGQSCCIFPWFSQSRLCRPSQKPWSDQHKSSRGKFPVPDTSLAAVLQQTPCQQSHVPYGRCINSLVSVHIRICCWGDLEGLWLGYCPKVKVKVKRFHGNYHMLVGSLTVCIYWWWRRPWGPAVVGLSPISDEWGSEVYLSVLIHPPDRFHTEGLHGGARGVVVIVGNEHGDTSSNPGRDWLHFT